MTEYTCSDRDSAWWHNTKNAVFYFVLQAVYTIFA